MKRCIQVIDLETTGLAPPEAGVCEIAYCYVVENDDGSWWVTDTIGYLVDPQRPIPPEVSAIHHIVDEDVAGAEPWGMHRLILSAALFGDARVVAWAAHNAKFERQWITDDLTGRRPVICTYKAALRLWPEAPSHSNQALRYWRKPKDLIRDQAALAHRAGPDAYVTAHLLREMLGAGATVEQLIEWSSQPALIVRVGFGKYRGRLWSEMDSGFLRWLLDPSREFDEDVRYTAQFYLDKQERE